jgi:hypothetical protein
MYKPYDLIIKKFLFQANISNEEYDRMYRVYQKSVEQTDLLRDLRESVEREDSDLINSQMKKIHLSPSGNNAALNCGSHHLPLGVDFSKNGLFAVGHLLKYKLQIKKRNHRSLQKSCANLAQLFCSTFVPEMVQNFDT